MNLSCNFLHFVLFLESVGSLRRNWRTTQEYVRSNYHDHQEEKRTLSSMEAMFKELKEDMKVMNFHLKMETADLSNFFPAKDNDQIHRFMIQDADFVRRRRGFYDLLKCVVAPTKKKFSEGLLASLFSLQYKRTKRWPSSTSDEASDQDVPPNFIGFLKFTLGKMAGLGEIRSDFIDLNFWKSMPGKFRSFKHYGKKLVRYSSC